MCSSSADASLCSRILIASDLALVVPFVDGFVAIETFVALQTDAPVSLPCAFGQSLRDFGLADARFALQQKRTPSMSISISAVASDRSRYSRPLRGGPLFHYGPNSP